LKLQDVQSLRKENPRPGGKRKPVEKDEDEEDAKKGDQPVVAGDEKGDDKAKEGEKVSLVVKNTAVPQVLNILTQHNVNLNQTKNAIGGIRKTDDGKEEAQRKKEVELNVNAVLLNNNEIRELKGLYDVLKDYVLWDINKLQWLNLSYNYLIKIDDDICKFENLKTLQL
jgi:hypothetical protein